MATKSIKSATSLAAICVAALVSITCGAIEDDSPTAPSAVSPSSSQTPSPAPSPTPAPSSGKASVKITINPNPVPHSGQPITDVAACSGVKNTWFYEQILEETNGVAITFSDRQDFFDGRVANTINNAGIQVPARGRISIRSRWCSSTATSHTAQTNFSGRDANGNVVPANGPQVTLQKP